MSKNFEAFFKFAGGSRKMFLIFNSLHFVTPIYGLISKNNNDHFLDIASLTGKCSFFLFDNIQLLSGFKVLPFNKGICDSIAVISIISSLFIDFGRKVYHLYCLVDQREDKKNKNEIDLELNNRIFITFIESTAVLGELLTLLNYSGLLRAALGKHSMFIGAIGGLWSGIVNLLMTYSKINNPIKPESKIELKEDIKTSVISLNSQLF